MKSKALHRYLSTLFIIAIILAFGGLQVLLEKPPFLGMANGSSFPPPLELDETQSKAVEACKFPLTSALPTPATQPVGIEVPVVLYHRVTNAKEPSSTVIQPKLFRAQMDALAKDGYTTVSVTQLTDYMNGIGKIPKKPVLITFDDGWKDNEEAAAYLNILGFKAIFYIISGFFDVPEYLSADDVRKLASNPNFEIGSHTHTHFIAYEKDLSSLDICNMAKEIIFSKTLLEKVINKPVNSLAWPYGHNTAEAIQLAKNFGYTSTMHVNRDAYNALGNSPYFIRRLNINGNCSVEDFRTMVKTRILNECK